MDIPLLEALSASAIRPIGDFDEPAALSSTAWAFAKLQCVDETLMAALAAQALALLSEFGSKELARMSWAFASLAMWAGTLLTSIASASLPLISEFSGQELSATAWAMAKLVLEN